jgi:hypothetical protein
MEVDVRQKRRQAEWLPVCNEMDLVSAGRESYPKLGCDRAGPAVRRITGDADLHEVSFHHRWIIESESGSSGSTVVTGASPSW